jgi:hypothetical protein
LPNSTLVWKGVFMDLYPVLKILRKIEFFILPLLPAGWREPPPSYRIALPVLNFLNRYTQKIRFIDPLIYSIKKEGYRPYHLDGLGQAGPFTRAENRWLALIFSVVLFVLILAFTDWGKEHSARIRTILFLGGSAFALYGAMKLRISALWAAWGFLSPLLSLLSSTALSSWFMVLLGLFVIVWAVPLLDPDDGWRWYDGLGTLPTLFFWMPLPFVPGWSRWATGMASFLFWGLVWLGMMWGWRGKTGKGGRVARFLSRTLQLFWVSNLASITIFASLIKPLLRQWGIYEVCPWSLWWLAVALGTAMIVSAFYARLVSWSFLFRGRVVLATAAVYGAALLLTSDNVDQVDWIATGLNYIYDSIWPVMWIIGAGIVFFMRRYAMILLQWIEALFSFWAFPLVMIVVPVAFYLLGWLQYSIRELGMVPLMAFFGVVLVASMMMAVKRRHAALKELVFWAVYTAFIVERYWFEVDRTAYGSTGAENWYTFLFLAVWILFLTYYALGGSLSELRKSDRMKLAPVLIIGALEWMILALLWMGYVDNDFQVRLRINLDLLNGFTFLGVPFLVYYLIADRYASTRTSQGLPWGWILLFGIGVVQLFQCIEHYVVGWFYSLSPEEVHTLLMRALVSKTPIFPQWVTEASWSWTWRLIRWVLVMICMTFAMRHFEEKKIVFFGTVFSSLAVCTAESIWIWWPGMQDYWAVVFRPWTVYNVIWTLDFAKWYLVYGFAGVIAGVLICRINAMGSGAKQGVA